MYHYNNALEILINKFPELRPIYEADKEEYADSPYLFYEPIFTDDYILEKIRGKNLPDLKRVFDFVEEMLATGDEKSKTLIGVTVIESLYFEQDFKKNYQDLISLFSPLTKREFESLMGR